MKITVGKTELEIYDSIETMPITRYQKFQLYTVLDSDCGQSVNDIMNKYAQGAAFINNDMKDKGLAVFENMTTGLYNIMSGLSPKALSFAVLIKSVDGEEKNNLDKTALEELVEDLSSKGVTWQTVLDSTEDVKKN